MTYQRVVIAASGIVLMTSTAVGTNAAGCASNPYPNELPGVRFFATARWAPLRPLISSQSEAFTLLGEPTPVFYDAGKHWHFIILYVGEGSHCDAEAWPASLTGKVASIELRPRKPLSFSHVHFPAVFERSQEHGAHEVVTSWDVYSDAYGLEYKVYNEDSDDGSTRAGDLRAIVYGPSRELFTVLTGCGRR